MRRSLAVLVALVASPAVLMAQTPPDWRLFYLVDRYYHANNAVSGAQMIATPTPLARGEKGDWRVTVSPGFVRVTADPLKFDGGSLNFGYSRRLDERWGLFAGVLTNRVETVATSASGSPNPYLLQASFTGLDNEPSYSSTYPAGASIFTLGEFAALTYTFPSGGPKGRPLTVFGGPVFAQSFARGLRHSDVFTGTYGGGAKNYRMDIGWQGSFNYYLNGGALGAVTEFDLGRFKMVPHVVGGLFIYNRALGRHSASVVEDLDGGLTRESTFEETTSRSFGVNIAGVQMFGFLIPGLDIIYKDWALGFNLIEPLGPVIARNRPASYILHGAWPFSITITRHFGRYQK